MRGLFVAALAFAAIVVRADHDDDLSVNRVLVLDGGPGGWTHVAEGARYCCPWMTSVDRVMGGKSSIALERVDDALRAWGVLDVSTGGFAGLSRQVDPTVDLSSYAGIRVTYEALDEAADVPLVFELRLTGPRWYASGIEFGASFALQPSSEAGARGTATIPFEAFRPRWRGRPASGTLDLTKIAEIGLQLLFQEGEFDVRFLALEAVPRMAPPDDPPPAVDASRPAHVVAELDAALARGAFLVDKGYMPQAVEVLAATCRAVAAGLDALAVQGLSPQESGDESDGEVVTLRDRTRAALARAEHDAADVDGWGASHDLLRFMGLRSGLTYAREAAIMATGTDDFYGWPTDAAPAPVPDYDVPNYDVPDVPDVPVADPVLDDDDDDDLPPRVSRCKRCVMTLFIFGIACAAFAFLAMICCISWCPKDKTKVGPFKEDEV